MLVLWFRFGAVLAVSAVIFGLVGSQWLIIAMGPDRWEVYQRAVLTHIFFALGILVTASQVTDKVIHQPVRHRLCALLLFGIGIVAFPLYGLAAAPLFHLLFD
jgi:hypothetical protein